MKRVVSFIISLILTVTLLNAASVNSLADPQTSTGTDAVLEGTATSIYGHFPETNSTSCILMDATTGQVIYEKNSHAKLPPASTTKIMTGYLAATQGDLDSIITMSNDAVWNIDRNSSHIALDVGEEISMSDALYATMLMSANEAAYAIAEQVSGSLEAFVTLMNETAASLGCKDTHFANANGLPDANHYSSAYDLALITRAAIANETFCKYAEETYHEIPPTNKNSDTRYLIQVTKMMLATSEYAYPYCKGGKNGYTDEAGGTLVTWADRDGMKIICVTMGAVNNSCNYEDNIKLYDYVYSNFSYETPLENFVFDAEDKTRAQTFLNSYYHCENYGVLKLSVDTSQPIIFPYDADSSELVTHFEPSAERLEEGYVGTLTVSYRDTTFLSLPVSYSGYVNSTDAAAVEQARQDGTLKPSLMNPKKDYKKWILGGGACLLLLLLVLLRVHAVKQKKAAEQQRRDRMLKRKELEEKRRRREFEDRHTRR